MGLVNLMQAVFDRVALTAGEDEAVMTSHWRVVLAAQPDTSPMDDTQRVAAENLFKAFWTSAGAYCLPGVKLYKFRWYDVPDAAPHKVKFISEHSITPAPGTGTGACIPQAAISVTFRTDARKHWGRFYLPGCTTNGLVAGSGRLSSSAVDGIAGAALALTSRSATGTPKPTLTVWSPTQGVRNDPQQVVVDDVPDVIRRRRFSSTSYKKIITAG
jgi:hypothetical protein